VTNVRRGNKGSVALRRIMASWKICLRLPLKEGKGPTVHILRSDQHGIVTLPLDDTALGQLARMMVASGLIYVARLGGTVEPIMMRWHTVEDAFARAARALHQEQGP